MPTTPPTLDDLPATPDRSDRSTFSARSTALFDQLKISTIPQWRAALANVFANATETYSYALDTQQAAGAAVTGANAPVWVSGATITRWSCVISPTDGQPYTRITATGSGTTDPVLDTTNYVIRDPHRSLYTHSSGGTLLVNVTNVIRTNSSSLAMVLPASPGARHRVYVKDGDFNANTFPFTINPGSYAIENSAPGELMTVRSPGAFFCLQLINGAWRFI